jgi:ABC-type transporter Mla subunit MlaD
VGSVLDSVERGTRGRGPELERTLRHSAEALDETAALANEVAADGAALRTLVADGRRVVGALAEDPAELQALTDELVPVLETTARRESELTRSLELLAPGLRSGRRALTELDASVPYARRLVRAARPAVSELVPTSRELRPTLAEARPTLSDLNAFAHTAPDDLRAVRPLLKELPPLAETLDSVLGQLNPALDQIRVRTPELTSFLQLAADLTANYDYVGHGGRVSLILGRQPRQLIGPSDDGSGCVRRPFDRTPGVLEGDPWTDYEDSFVGRGRPTERFLSARERESPDGRSC